MAKPAKLLHLIREKVRNQEYEFAIPHFFEEMANDDFALADIELALTTGWIHRVFTDDPRGDRYEIIGQACDGRPLAVICRLKETGKLWLITTWEVYE